MEQGGGSRGRADAGHTQNTELGPVTQVARDGVYVL
jgi:hypothetical protein